MSHAQMSRMQSEIADLRADLAEYGAMLRGQASEARAEGAGRLRGWAEQAQGRATLYGDSARRQARVATGAARGQIRSHPLSTLAGAFAVGIVLGAILGRR